VTPWNLIGVLSTSLFVTISPEIKKISDHQYKTNLDEAITCDFERLESGTSIKYCLSQMKENSKRLVYFFPGILHSEYAWIYQRKNRKLREKWHQILNQDLKNSLKKNDVPDIPDVLAVSVDPFFIAQQDDQVSQSLVKEILIKIEKKVGLNPKERIFYGNSLGAYNAFQLAYMTQKYPLVQIQKLILGCPFIPVENPFLKKSYKTNFFIFNDYKSQSFSQIKESVYLWLLKRFQLYKFKTQEDWLNSSPIFLAEKINPQNFPLTDVVVGDHDDFYFMDGAKKLSQVLREKNILYQFKEINGGHCVVDTDQISDFILKK